MLPKAKGGGANLMRAAARTPKFSKEAPAPKGVDEFYGPDRESGDPELAKLPQKMRAPRPTGAPKTSSVPLFGGKK
jgi:hypothetical protein